MFNNTSCSCRSGFSFQHPYGILPVVLGDQFWFKGSNVLSGLHWHSIHMVYIYTLRYIHIKYFNCNIKIKIGTQI